MASAEYGESYPGTAAAASPEETPLMNADGMAEGGEVRPDPLVAPPGQKKSVNWFLYIIIALVLLAVIIGAIIILKRRYDEESLLPIIYIPTMAVSALHITVPHNITADGVPVGNCPSGSFQLYPNDTMRNKFATCLSQYLTVYYTPSQKIYNFTNNVTISVEWGTANGLATFADGNKQGFTYLSKDVTAMIDEWGYTHNKNFAVAPYDWRLAPKTLATSDDFGERLRAQIVKMYKDNDKKKVHLLAHGTGGLVIREFLKAQDQPWRNDYIASYMTFGTPFQGIMSLWSLLSFDHHYLYSDILMNNNPYRESFLYASFPSVSHFYANQVAYKTHNLVSIPLKNSNSTKNYTVPATQELIKTNLYKPRFAERWPAEATPPAKDSVGVDTYCYIGTKLPTISQYAYNDTSLMSYSNVTLVSDFPGDGLVDEYSLNGCRVFGNSTSTSGNKFQVKEFPGVAHVMYFRDQGVRDAVKAVLDTYVQ